MCVRLLSKGLLSFSVHSYSLQPYIHHFNTIKSIKAQLAHCELSNVIKITSAFVYNRWQCRTIQEQNIQKKCEGDMQSILGLNLSFFFLSLSLSPSVSLYGRSSVVVPRLGPTVNQQQQPTSQHSS